MPETLQQIAEPRDDDRHAEVATRMGIVITGHVDHGKSTIIGRLLADTDSLPQGKLQQVRDLCARTAKPFEYAFLLDALKDEQAQGITIDAARIFFKSQLRHYVILDAPGHIEFLKNMITGAAHAEAALLVIDAAEGIQENSRRHGYMLSLLGVKQIAVLINKMDLVSHDERVFRDISQRFGKFLGQFGVVPSNFIPVSGRDGDNIASPSRTMTWFTGPTVLEALDSFATDRTASERPFRMPVQGVYKFTEDGDDRRIVAGGILTGAISEGDTVIFYPSGKRSRVKNIEGFNQPQAHTASAGTATGFTLEEQIYVSRGEVAARAGEPKPKVTTRLRVSLFWLGRQPFTKNGDYTLKLGSARVPVRVEAIHRVMNAASLDTTDGHDRVERNDVAECTLKLGRPLAFDEAAEIPELGRFVLVEDYEIRGGGIIREALPDRQSWLRERVLLRNYKWEPSDISPEHRAERYAQLARLILITGERSTDRKPLARELERRLFDDGRNVYFLGMSNVIYGVDSDLGRGNVDRGEHMRRLAEIANIMLDSGAILIVTASDLNSEDLETVKAGVDADRVTTIWLGDPGSADMHVDLHIGAANTPAEGAEQIKGLLRDQGVIFRPW